VSSIDRSLENFLLVYTIDPSLYILTCAEELKTMSKRRSMSRETRSDARTSDTPGCSGGDGGTGTQRHYAAANAASEGSWLVDEQYGRERFD
jgi:hypothetical protein